MNIPDAYSPEEKSEIRRRYYELLNAWSTHKDIKDRWLVRKAYLLAVNAHKDQRRRTGEPYIYHPLEVATIAAKEIGLGRTSIICALLHDVVEDTDYTLDDLSAIFGDTVASIIDGVTKIDKMSFIDSPESMQAENFRKIIVAFATDARAILIKLADRLHNMRTLDAMPANKQLKIASETAYLYVPFAYRLGLYAIKSEMEDLALKYTDPAVYKTITQKMEEIRPQRIAELNEFVTPIENLLKQQKIKAKVQIKEKSANSVWQRMKEKEIPFEEVHDAFIIRFVIDCPLEQEKIECWKVYAILTSIYRPNTKRLRDWISLPKANGYESLHAVVMNKTGKWIEVQIRSERMEEIAEKGFVAFMRSNTENKNENGFEEWLKKVKYMIANENDSALEFVNSIKLDLFSDEIFVFTPKGEMISLPKGSTALDLAYHIHSEIGNHSIAANINNKIAQLDQQLYTGDQVEIITSDAQHPQEKWFNYLVSSFALSRLKIGLKDYRKGFREDGERKYLEIMKHIGMETNKTNRNRIMEAVQVNGSVDLYYFIAIGKIDETRIKAIFQESHSGNSLVRFLTFGILGNKTKQNNQQFDHSRYKVAECCRPIPGDDVVCLSFENRPVEVHRTHCPRAITLMSQYGDNITKTKWQPNEKDTFPVTLKIVGVNIVGFVNKITNIISNELKLPIQNFKLQTSNEVAEVLVSVYVHNTKELNELINTTNKLKIVKKITRY